MSNHRLLELVEQSQVKPGRGDFEIGDTVDVHIKIKEGDKERTQVFTGLVIAMHGAGSGRSFTVRRLVGSEGVERVFPLNCPSIDKIEVHKKGKVRRAKLYYLRKRVGKATRVAERFQMGEAATAAEEPPPLVEAVKPRQAAAAPKAEAPQAEASAEKKS